MATPEDLQAAFTGESQANRKYLAFAKKAEADGYPQIAKLFRAVAGKNCNQAALNSFKFAMPVEQIHHGLYTKAMQAVTGETDLPAARIFGCGGSGHTIYGEAPYKCPICGAP